MLQQITREDLEFAINMLHQYADSKNFNEEETLRYYLTTAQVLLTTVVAYIAPYERNENAG